MSRSVGSVGSAGHGNVLRTPFGQRDEDKERVNVLTILSNLESIVVNLDSLNQKISGLTLRSPRARSRLSLLSLLFSLSLSLSLPLSLSLSLPHSLSLSLYLSLSASLSLSLTLFLNSSCLVSSHDLSPSKLNWYSRLLCLCARDRTKSGCARAPQRSAHCRRWRKHSGG